MQTASHICDVFSKQIWLQPCDGLKGVRTKKRESEEEEEEEEEGVCMMFAILEGEKVY